MFPTPHLLHIIGLRGVLPGGKLNPEDVNIGLDFYLYAAAKLQTW